MRGSVYVYVYVYAITGHVTVDLRCAGEEGDERLDAAGRCDGGLVFTRVVGHRPDCAGHVLLDPLQADKTSADRAVGDGAQRRGAASMCRGRGVVAGGRRRAAASCALYPTASCALYPTASLRHEAAARSVGCLRSCTLYPPRWRRPPRRRRPAASGAISAVEIDVPADVPRPIGE